MVNAAGFGIFLFVLPLLAIAGTQTHFPEPTKSWFKTNKSITPEILAYGQALVDQYGVRGLSVGVVHLHQGSVDVEYGSWGVRTEEGDPVTKDSLFAIGSCSKAFLAAALGILIDDFANGKNVTALPENVSQLTWDTKVKDTFPEDFGWRLYDEWASEKANFKDILGHVSGIPRHELSYSLYDAPIEVARKLRYLKPQYELREQWSYSNLAYMVSSTIITSYSGMPFTEFIETRIFDPLEMTSTTYSASHAEKSGHLNHAFGVNKRRIPFLFEHEDTQELMAGPGGIISSAVDMNKWLATLLNRGVNPSTDEVVIPKEAFDTVTSAHQIVGGQGAIPEQSIVGYGMGWMRLSYQGHEIITHGGGLPGFLTNTAFLPSDGLAVFAVINSMPLVPVQGLVSNRIIESTLGLKRIASLRPTDVVTSPLISSLATLADFPFSQPLLPQEEVATPLITIPTGDLLLNMASYTGTYSNPGYGSFTLCARSSSSMHDRNDGCAEVISNFTSVFPTLPSQALYASWSRIVVSHIQLNHKANHTFGFSGYSLYPAGYGKDESPFALDFTAPLNVEYEAEFDVEDGSVVGLAFMDSFDSLPGMLPRKEGKLKDVAYLYFAKSGAAAGSV